MSRQRNKPGRPPATWLSPEAITRLPVGVVISVERIGAHTARLRGRITHTTRTSVQLTTTRGSVTLLSHHIKRARIVDDLYEPGDPVLRPGVPAESWRGGVVRSQGTDVLVEQIGGEYAWFPEDQLEPAEARDLAEPLLPRGPVPSRTRNPAI